LVNKTLLHCSGQRIESSGEEYNLLDSRSETAFLEEAISLELFSVLAGLECEMVFVFG
jgi:hypothetical protein